MIEKPLDRKPPVHRQDTRDDNRIERHRQTIRRQQGDDCEDCGRNR